MGRALDREVPPSRPRGTFHHCSHLTGGRLRCSRGREQLRGHSVRGRTQLCVTRGTVRRRKRPREESSAFGITRPDRCGDLRLLTNLNVGLPSDPAVPLLGLDPADPRADRKQTRTHTCSLRHHSQPPAGRKRPVSLPAMADKRGPPHDGMLFSHKEEWGTDTCYSTDEPRKHGAE